MAVLLKEGKLDALFSCKEVTVVQSIDAAALRTLLSDLLKCQAAADAQIQAQQDEIEKLKQIQLTEKQAHASDKHQDAQHEDAAVPAEIPKHHSPKPAVDAQLQPQSTKADQDVQDKLDQFDRRLSRLETKRAASEQHASDSAEVLAGSQSEPPTTVQNSDFPVASLPTTNVTDKAPASAVIGGCQTDHASAIQKLQLQQSQFVSQLAGLRAGLSAAVDDVKHQIATELGSKADASQVQSLLASLSSKADSRDLQQVRNQLGTKADRSELDAVLSSFGSSAGQSPVPAQGVGDAACDVDEAAVGQIAKLQLQLTVLQERMAKKADVSEVHNVSEGLAAAQQQTVQLQLVLQQLTKQVAGTHAALDNLAAAQKDRQVQQQMACNNSHDGTVVVHAAPSEDALVQLQQLPIVLLRLSAAEDALAALTGQQAAAAVSSAVSKDSGRDGDKPTPRTPSACNDAASAVKELVAAVAHMQQQIRQLFHMHQPNTTAHLVAASPSPPQAVAAVSSDDMSSSASGHHHTKSNTDNDEQATVDNAAALSELFVRIAGIEQLVENLAASKPDRGELESLRGMLAETASQSDTEMLKHKLDSQQSLLSHLMQQLSATMGTATSTVSPSAGSASAASKQSEAKTPKLLGKRELSSPSAAAASNNSFGNSVDGSCAVAQLDADILQNQLQQQQAHLELLAEALNLLATGKAASHGTANAASSVGNAGAADSAPTPAGDALQDDSGTTTAGGSPQLARLRRLIQTGQVVRKLDWFDPALLQKMAQRLAAAEAIIKMQPRGTLASNPDSNGDRLKRLAADVKTLKERLGEVIGAALPSKQLPQGGWGVRGDGDHTMLAAKPVAGYRCMACDRPLAALDARPGPFLPTGAMPVSVLAGAETAAAGAAVGKLPPAGSRRNTLQEPQLVPPSAHSGDMPLGGSPCTSPEPGVCAARRVTGPQNWYTAAHGLPAEQLPKGDVGPHLPPGGWRGNLPRGDDGSALPVLVSRGGGGFGGAAGAANGR